MSYGRLKQNFFAASKASRESYEAISFSLSVFP
jgi:hypothetical protein